MSLSKQVRRIGLVRGLVAAAGVCLLLGWAVPSALASHVSCGQTIVADTTLDTDLVNCPGDGVVIGADGVSLDLAGHGIDGVSSATSSESAGVRFREVDDVEVKNGFITDFTYGVYARSANGGRLTQLDVRRTGFGIVVEAFSGFSTDFRIDHNTSAAFNLDGIALFGNVHEAVVEDNVVIGGFNTLGILVDGCCNEILRNSLSKGGVGISIGGSLHLVAENNGFENRIGIAIGSRGSFNEVVRNSVFRNTSFGVRLDDSDQNHVAGNSAQENVQAGISIGAGFGDGSDSNVVERNEAIGNGVGIDLDHEANDNRLLENSTSENAGDGILVRFNQFRPTTNGELNGNESFGNGDDGIDVDAPGEVIAGNSAYQNGDWGIEAVDPASDGGGNRAWSNGQPDQCLYVVCGPGPPTSLTLSPASATNEIGGTHCVTATSVDPDGRATPGLTVRFSVSGDPAGNTAEGAAVTDDLGQAQFCYDGPLLGPSTDEITAFADGDGDGTQDAGEPAGTAEKLWVLPVTADCKLSGAVTLVAANGDRARAYVNVRSRGDAAPSGRHSYVDYGPAESLVVRSITVDSLVCGSSGSATILGEARVSRSGTVLYRIDVEDGGSGRNDTYRIRLSSGYDSGEAPLTSGNLRLR